MDLNNEVLAAIMILPDSVRKHVRLLAKQYDIIEAYQKPDIKYDKRIIQNSPFIIRYRDFETLKEFEIQIDLRGNKILDN